METLTEQLERRAEELQRAHGETRQLLELANAIIGTTDRAALFDSISEALGRFVSYDRLALLLYREEIGALELYALSGRLADRRPWPIGTRLAPGDVQAWAAIEKRQSVIIDDLGDDPATYFDQKLVELGVRGLLAVPLIAKDRVLGLLGVASSTPGQYSESDADRLSRVAGQLALAVEKLLAFEEITRLKSELEQENLYLREEIKTEHDFEEIVGESQALREVLKAVETVAPTDAGVLISGETGTGKELIARALHSLSDRREKPLVKVNCAAIPEGLVESELFGHEKGAFTGALSRKVGRFELAHGGTIFLDEIGDLQVDLQSKLLRVLQEGEFERIGSTSTLVVDVRVIAATNQDLAAAVAGGRFRSDLFYRLNVFPIEVPPLRDRGDDVRLLVNYFAMRFSQKLNRRISKIPVSTMRQLTSYRWPGNVRELRNVIERAVILSPGQSLELGAWFRAESLDSAASKPLKLDDVQRQHILDVLEQTGWRVSGTGGAAELLGLKPTTLDYRMNKLGIHRRSR